MRYSTTAGFAVTLLVVAAITAHAAVPSGVHVQGRLTDSTGSPLPDKMVEMEFKIFDAEFGGTKVWPPGGTADEILEITTDADGLWNTRIGESANIDTKSLHATFFSDTVRWLEITVNDGIGAPVTLPRTRLVTTPYAFQAAEAMQSVWADTASYAMVAPDDGDWEKINDILQTFDYCGLRRGGGMNDHVGDSGLTAVNFGTACTTGYFLNPTDGHMVVGGGFGNSSRYWYCTVAGGFSNIANDTGCTIGGGWDNSATDKFAAVSGGAHNDAGGESSTIGGGHSNGAYGDYATIGGGFSNETDGNYATVAGGFGCDAFGSFATVPGGYWNSATGDKSFAAGFASRAKHDGSVVISAFDGSGPTDSVWSTASNQMVLRSGSGFYLTTLSEGASIPVFHYLETSTGAYLSALGDWVNASDKHKKERFAPVDRDALLDKVARLDIQSWRYKGDSARHIGPTAQDFHALFGVGHDSTSISTIDPAGIALAAIQELQKRNEELEVTIADLLLRLERIEAK